MKSSEKISGFFIHRRIWRIKFPSMLIHEALTNGKATHEGWRVRKDKSRFWGSIVITALHDKQGEVIGFL